MILWGGMSLFEVEIDDSGDSSSIISRDNGLMSARLCLA